MSDQFEVQAVDPAPIAPSAGSPSLRLNGLDAKSVGRFILHWIIGAVAAELPLLMGMSYVISVNGHEYNLTIYVVFGLGALSKLIARYVTNNV